MHVINPKITNRQIQTINGTILGGSSLVIPRNGKNPYLSMRGKNINWINYKVNLLSNLSGPKSTMIEKTVRWHSLCYPLFWDFMDKFYKNNKRSIQSEALDLLSDVAFAIWFGDCGNYNGKEITLNTHVWGENGTKAIKTYFNQIGYESRIVLVRGSHRVTLDEGSSNNFLSLAAPHLPAWFLDSAA